MPGGKTEERKPTSFPGEQAHEMPAKESEMQVKPRYDNPNYKGSGKLKGKVAIISGGDSGIGRSVAVHFAREGADVVVIYLKEHEDAQETKRMVEKEGTRCILIAGDLCDPTFCQRCIDETMQKFQKIDILVNHAGVQWVKEKLEEITEEQFDRTMKTNVYAYFYLTRSALPHMKSGSAIINTTSINAFRGHGSLIDYSASKGADESFTHSLAQSVSSRGIRVNAVAPGPIWTPLIPGSFPSEKVSKFGQQTLFGRAGQPEECAPSYVFLASNADSSYITGQTIHVNGGSIIHS